MPSIEISDDQHAYLEDLRTRLAAEHVGAYGHVRFRDAIQYLIDVAEDDVTGTPAESADPSGSSATDGPEDGAEPASDADRLNAMMNLLETHADRWDESESEDAKYVVELPDGSTESARTRDEVRALLFKHYA